MKIGLIFSNTGPLALPEGAAALAEAAETAGIESIWTVEHVVVPVGYESEYPYAASGKMPGGHSIPISDPFSWLSFVAALTTKVKLGTGILILTERNPLIVAKEAATLATLSKDRFMMGVGVGWLKEEFEALSVPWERRGERLEDYIAAMRALWSGRPVSYEGEFVSFGEVSSLPSPPGGRVPIHIGGDKLVSARRAGRIGDGFFPGRTEEIPRLVDVMRSAAEEAGRDPESIEVTVGGPPQKEYVDKMRAAGVDRVCFPPMAFTPDQIAGAIDQLMNTVAN